MSYVGNEKKIITNITNIRPVVQTKENEYKHSISVVVSVVFTEPP